MNFEAELHKLQFDELKSPDVSGEVLEHVRDAIIQILDGKYSPDKEKIKNTTRKLSGKILNQSNGFEQMQKKYEKMKPLKIAKKAVNSKMDSDILSCVSAAFSIGKKNSSPLLALYTIFKKLGEIDAEGYLAGETIKRLKDFTLLAIKQIESKNKKKSKKK